MMNQSNARHSPAADAAARLRKAVYLLLITLSGGAMLGRILAVDSVDRYSQQQARIRQVLGGNSTLAEYLDWKRRDLAAKGLPADELRQALEEARAQKTEELREVWICRPFLSSNDRSRWCTVRALVEPDLRVPGAPYAIDNVIQQPGWDTIDMVKHARRWAGAADEAAPDAASLGENWDGRQRGGHLYSSKPPLLPTLMAGQYWLIYRLTGWTLGQHPYLVGRLMLVTGNLIPLLIYFLVMAALVERFGQSDFGRLFAMAVCCCGTFLSTFVVTINNHLPAAVSAAVALYCLVRIWFDADRRWRWFVLGGLFAGFMAANELPALALLGLIGLALLCLAPGRTLLAWLPALLVVAAAFFGTNWVAHRSLLPPYFHRGGGGQEDWYDYTYIRDGRLLESYWNDPRGVDRGEPYWPKYALHVLVGHHGIFSLTPVWLLSALGAAFWLCRREDPRLRGLAAMIGLATLVCLAFYLQPQKGATYRNYGGMTCGLRWMFWFAPLWIVVMLPAVDRMAARRWLRALGLLLLALSVLSASYPTWNPWTHPWLMDLLAAAGWA